MNTLTETGRTGDSEIVAAARAMLAAMPEARAYVKTIELENVKLRQLLREIAIHLAKDAQVNESTIGRISMDNSEPDFLYSRVLAAVNLQSACDAEDAALDVTVREFERHANVSLYSAEN